MHRQGCAAVCSAVGICALHHGRARPYIPDGQILVDVAKGMEPDTLYTMTEVIADELNREGGPKGKGWCLSGPTHAEEVALDLPQYVQDRSATPPARHQRRHQGGCADV